MNLLTLLIIILVIIYLVRKNILGSIFSCMLDKSANQIENFTNPSQTNLAALSRNELQTPRQIDLSKINWSKVDDYTYSQIVCLIQGCDEKAIIKNLPIFTSN